MNIIQIDIKNSSKNRTNFESNSFISFSYVGPELYKPYRIVNSLSCTIKRLAVCFVTNKNDSSSSV